MTDVPSVAGPVLVVLLPAVAGFFIGGINPATIFARLLRRDLSEGSGNPGATNAGRVLGVGWGVLVGVLDVLKGLLPTLLALLTLGRLSAYAVGLACVLGHILSPYLRGRGGKGVATTLGAVLAVFPWLALVLVVVFGVMVWRFRWVAGASIASCLLLLVYSLVLPLPPPVLAGRVFGAALAVVVLLRHRPNIRGYLRARGLDRAWRGASDATPDGTSGGGSDGTSGGGASGMSDGSSLDGTSAGSSLDGTSDGGSPDGTSDGGAR